MKDYAIIGYFKTESAVCYVSSVYASYCSFSDERQSAIHVPCDIANDVARWFMERQQYSGRDGANKKWFVETVKTEIDRQALAL